jgi:hypothetical protein
MAYLSDILIIGTVYYLLYPFSIDTDSFFKCTQSCCLILVLNPQEERAMAGLGVGEDHKIPVEPYGNRGQPDHVDIKDLEPGLYIPELGIGLFDEIAGLFKGRIPEHDLVIH